MQKISSLHTLTLTADLRVSKMAMPIFDHAYYKTVNNFQLSYICISMQKISLFHEFILDIQSILQSCDQAGHTQTVLTNFSFMRIYINT